MNIVFLNPSGALGGAETALLEMVAALRESRPDWNLSLVVSADGPLNAKARAAGISTASLEFPTSLERLGEWRSRTLTAPWLRTAAATAAAAPVTLAYAARLRRHLKTIAPDIVHTNGLKMHVLGAYARPARAKLVWHMHDYPNSRPFTRAVLQRHANRCSAVIANSASVAASTQPIVGTDVPVHTIHNAIDVERFRPEGPCADLDALAHMPPLAAGGVRIGLVATFARWKGHEIFLDALAKLRAVNGVRGYIIGGPIYETSGSQYSLSELRRAAAGRGVEDIVGFTGVIDDVPAAMRALDIVVHASVEPEPFGLVIAEAMSCGRPVVVSRAGGAVEVAAAGAWFHSPGNAAELAECLCQLVRDPSRRATLGTAGRRAAVAMFSKARLAQQLVPLYESLAHS